MEPELVLVVGLIGDLIAIIEEFVLDLTTNTYNAVGWFGVVVMMAIENVIIPLPSEIVMPLAGWKLVLEPGHGAWHLVLAGLFGALGSLIGSLITYWIGAAGGRPLLERYGRYVLITRRDLARADHWFATRGELTVFVTRLIPVVRGFISLPAGVSRMNIWRFSAYTFAGAFPWSFGLAWGGYLLGDNWESLRSTTRPFDIPIIIAVLLAIAWYVWHKRKELRRDAEETRQPE